MYNKGEFPNGADCRSPPVFGLYTVTANGSERVGFELGEEDFNDGVFNFSRGPR